MLDFNKLFNSLPKIDNISVKMMTFDEVIEILNALDDVEESMDNMEDEDTDIKTEQQKNQEVAEFEENNKIDKYHPDGTEKTKIEIADERWERRQKWEREFEDKFAKSMAKFEAFINKIIEDISKWVSIALTLMNIMTYLNKLFEIIEELIIKFENSPFVQELNAKIQVLMLKIKRISLKIKMKLNEIELNMWTGIYEGKCIDKIVAAQQAVQIAMIYLNFGMTVLNNLLAMLPSMLEVTGEGLSFFLTPKSLKATQIPILNPHHSVGDILDNLTEQAITEVKNTLANSNIAIKSSNIAANVAATQAAGILSTPAVAQVEAVLMENIYKGIDFIVNLLPMPKPLPKFEQLNIVTNPGFLLFLATGWCRAGQVAFGMPGPFPGIPALPPELKEL